MFRFRCQGKKNWRSTSSPDNKMSLFHIIRFLDFALTDEDVFLFYIKVHSDVSEMRLPSGSDSQFFKGKLEAERSKEDEVLCILFHLG